MAQEQMSLEDRSSAERRCPQCGTRVARDAETCFMCGHDLRIQPRQIRRVSWIDALLVLAVLAVLVFWWQMGSRTRQDAPVAAEAGMILPTNIPVLDPTLTPAPTLEPTPTTAPPAPEEVFLTHTVQAGETLLTIAGIYDTTVEEIQLANNLTDVLIRAGDELVVPVLRSDDGSEPGPVLSEFTYTVKEGDTVVSIAVLFGSTITEILQANNLAATDIIRPGDTLVIPVRNAPAEALTGDALPAAPATPANTNAPALEAGTVYIEPRLTGPANRAVLSREEPVLLRWVSVDLLAPNEWYVLMIYPMDGAAQPLPTVWTKATSHRLDAELAPPPGQSAEYGWQVSVARVLTQPDGRRQLEAASPPSLVRSFTWE